MSLKAKIEAVVYAAEEPVTLAQLAALFADEALAYKLEYQPVLPLDGEVPDQESLLDVSAGGGDADPLPFKDDEAVEGAAAADSARPENADAAASLSGAGEDARSAGEASAEGAHVAGSEGTAAEDAEPATAGARDVDASAMGADSDLTGDAFAGLRESPAAAEKRLARVRDREVKEILREQLEELIREYAQSDRGIEIRQIAGGYRIGTKPEYHDSVRGFVKSLKPPMKLSLQALETLAVIAYKQPVTAPEVSEIRGVDTSGVLGSLISRKLITTAGRKQVIGRPILYKTTKEFLLRFGLKDVNELPSIEEFEKMAGELADADVQEDPHVAAPEELPFFETSGGYSESAGDEKEPLTQGGDSQGGVGGQPEPLASENGEDMETAKADHPGSVAEIVTSVSDVAGDNENPEKYVTEPVANADKSAAETVGADENGYPSEAQTVPGGAETPPEDLKEDR